MKRLPYTYLLFNNEYVKLKAALVSAIFFLFSIVPAWAGGGPVYLDITQYPHSGSFYAKPGEYFTVQATVQAQADNMDSKCKQCEIKFMFQDPYGGDKVEQSSDKTDDNGQAGARVSSPISAIRYVYAQVHLPDGNVYNSSVMSLTFSEQAFATAPPAQSATTPQSTTTPTIKPTVKPAATTSTTAKPKASVKPTTTIKPSPTNSASVSAKPVPKIFTPSRENEKNIFSEIFQGLIIWFKSIF